MSCAPTRSNTARCPILPVTSGSTGPSATTGCGWPGRKPMARPSSLPAGRGSDAWSPNNCWRAPSPRSSIPISPRTGSNGRSPCRSSTSRPPPGRPARPPEAALEPFDSSLLDHVEAELADRLAGHHAVLPLGDPHGDLGFFRIDQPAGVDRIRPAGHELLVDLDIALLLVTQPRVDLGEGRRCKQPQGGQRNSTAHRKSPKERMDVVVCRASEFR